MKILQTLFSILRWTVGLILCLVLLFVLLIGIPTSSVSIAVTDRENVKHIISSSDIVKNPKQLAIEYISNQPTDTESEDNFLLKIGEQLQDPNDELTQLVDKVLNTEFLTNSSNTIIDSYYDWLEGKTDKPTFNISIIEDKEDLITLLSLSFIQKAKSLPECDRNFRITPDFDPLNSNCWPQGIEYEEVDKYIRANSDHPEFDNFLKHATLSSENINIDSEITGNIKGVFNTIRLTPVVSTLLVILLWALIILVIPKYKRGYIIVVLITGITALVWIICSLILTLFVNNFITFVLQKVNNEQISIIYPYISSTTEEIAHILSKSVILYSTLLILISLLPILIKKVIEKIKRIKTTTK